MSVFLTRHTRPLPPRTERSKIPVDWNVEMKATATELEGMLRDNVSVDTLVSANLSIDLIRSLPLAVRKEYEAKKKAINTVRRQEGVVYRKRYAPYMKDVIGFLLDTIMRYLTSYRDGQIILYGTGVYNRLLHDCPEYNASFTFTGEQETYDIDVAAHDPDDLAMSVYTHLMNCIHGYDIVCRDAVFTIDRVELSKDSYKNAITIIVKCDSYHVARHTILDCIPLSSYTFSTMQLGVAVTTPLAPLGNAHTFPLAPLGNAHTFPLAPLGNAHTFPLASLGPVTTAPLAPLIVQSPLAYLTGMVDKLYNSQLNPNIDPTNRADAEEKMIRRFHALRLHNVDVNALLEESQRFPCISKIPLARQFIRLLAIDIERAIAPLGPANTGPLAWYTRHKEVIRVIKWQPPPPVGYQYKENHNSRYSDEEFATIKSQLIAGAITIESLFERGLTGDQLRSLPKELRKTFTTAFEEYLQKRSVAIEAARHVHEEASIKVTEYLKGLVWSWSQEMTTQLEKSHKSWVYHGSYAYNELSRGTPEYDKVFTFDEPLSTGDIDTYVENAAETANEMYRKLYEHCIGSEFRYKGQVYTVSHLILTRSESLSKHSIAIKLKHGDHHIWRQNIFDAVELSRRAFSITTFNGFRVQTPAAFICGNVGKLFAPRGNDKVLEDAIRQKLRERLQKMKLKRSPELTALVLEESKKVKSIVESKEAQEFLLNLMQQ